MGLVYGHAPYWTEGEPLPPMTARWSGTRVWSGRDWLRLRCRTAQNCISSPEAIVAPVQAVGGYDPDCYHASDLNMWLRIAAVSDVAYVRAAPQAIYRVHGDSMLAAPTTRSPTCASAGRPSTRLRSGAETVPDAAALSSWPRRPLPGRRCGAPAGRSTAK